MYVIYMGRINYEISDDLHKRLRHRAVDTGETLIALIVRYLEEGLAQEEGTS
jgi:hypothetical protein